MLKTKRVAPARRFPSENEPWVVLEWSFEGGKSPAVNCSSSGNLRSFPLSSISHTLERSGRYISTRDTITESA